MDVRGTAVDSAMNRVSITVPTRQKIPSRKVPRLQLAFSLQTTLPWVAFSRQRHEIELRKGMDELAAVEPVSRTPWAIWILSLYLLPLSLRLLNGMHLYIFPVKDIVYTWILQSCFRKGLLKHALAGDGFRQSR